MLLLEFTFCSSKILFLPWKQRRKFESVLFCCGFFLLWFDLFVLQQYSFHSKGKIFPGRTFDSSCSTNLNTIMQFSCAIISNEKKFTNIFQKNILPSKNIFRNTKEHSSNWHNCIWNLQKHGAENNYTFELRKPSWNTKNALLDLHFQDPNFLPHRICWSEFWKYFPGIQKLDIYSAKASNKKVQTSKQSLSPQVAENKGVGWKNQKPLLLCLRHKEYFKNIFRTRKVYFRNTKVCFPSTKVQFPKTSVYLEQKSYIQSIKLNF